jgi:hypothetical protein
MVLAGLPGKNLFRFLILMLLLPACAGSKVSSPRSFKSETPLPGLCEQSSSTASPTASSSNKGRLRVEEATSFVARDGNVGDLFTWGHYLAWPGAERGHRGFPNWNRITVCDLDTGVGKTVAGTESARGELGAVQGSKDTVVYTELAHTLTTSTNDGMVSPWTLYSVNIRTGQRRQLAASSTRGDEGFLPEPQIDWPWVVVRANPKGPGLTRDISGDIVVFDLRTGKRRILLSGKHPGRIAITNGMVVYTGTSDPKRPDIRDIFEVPVDGSAPPKQLTTSGYAEFPQAANEALTWAEIPPSPKDAVRTGVNPLWVLSLDGKGPPINFAEGTNSFPGKGFVMWQYPNLGLLARDPSLPDDPIVLSGPEAYGFSAYGDRAAWTAISDDSPGHPTVWAVHVARVVKS